MNELTIGQMVYYVPSDSRSKPYWLRINKIGWKWVTLQYNYRMDRVTWEMDGAIHLPACVIVQKKIMT
jgi:hypothetical protein